MYYLNGSEGGTLKRLTLVVFGLVGLLAFPSARATLLGPSPYLCFDSSAIAGCGTAESPFANLSFSSYFYLEDFEDALLNTPGVTGSGDGPTSVVFGPTIHDSVDEDDGTIDGSGLLGDSYFAGSGAAGITFTFDAGVLGLLPTHVGIVWTDGGGGATVSFEAFDANGNSLGILNFSGADNSNNGETGEDRFFGAIDLGGLSSILITNSFGGIEVDHLQYGSGVVSVPEPDALALIGIGLAILFLTRRRMIKVPITAVTHRR
jgi:hypothetical protein